MYWRRNLSFDPIANVVSIAISTKDVVSVFKSNISSNILKQGEIKKNQQFNILNSVFLRFYNSIS